MATKNQISGGAFQDALGNPVALGYMTFELSQDAQVNANTQLGAGRIITITLDSSGNVAGTQSMWPNDQLSPAGTFYNVSVYTANGQLVWGPNAQQVLSTPSPYDIGVWVPAAVNISAGGGGGGGGGTVTNVSVVTANGFSGSVANSTSTPAITISPAGFLNQDNNWTATQTLEQGLNSANAIELLATAAATSVSNEPAPSITFLGNYWDGATSQIDTWSITPVFNSGAEPESILHITHPSGTTGGGLIEVDSLSVGGTFTATGAVTFVGSTQFDGQILALNDVSLISTSATSSGNTNPPPFAFNGNFWNGSISVNDSWIFTQTLGTGNNPTTKLTLQHSGSSGVAELHVPNLNLDAAITSATASAGSATLPANPLGFWEFDLNGTAVKIPYYAA